MIKTRKNIDNGNLFAQGSVRLNPDHYNLHFPFMTLASTTALLRSSSVAANNNVTVPWRASARKWRNGSCRSVLCNSWR